jgi:hypothetical protein
MSRIPFKSADGAVLSLAVYAFPKGDAREGKPFISVACETGDLMRDGLIARFPFLAEVYALEAGPDYSWDDPTFLGICADLKLPLPGLGSRK